MQSSKHMCQQALNQNLFMSIPPLLTSPLLQSSPQLVYVPWKQTFYNILIPPKKWIRVFQVRISPESPGFGFRCFTQPFGFSGEPWPCWCPNRHPGFNILVLCHHRIHLGRRLTASATLISATIRGKNSSLDILSLADFGITCKLQTKAVLKYQPFFLRSARARAEFISKLIHSCNCCSFHHSDVQL